jgi:hypothetical protein
MGEETMETNRYKTYSKHIDVDLHIQDILAMDPMDRTGEQEIIAKLIITLSMIYQEIAADDSARFPGWTLDQVEKLINDWTEVVV